MKQIYIPSKDPEDWRPFLGRPDTQWRTGYSAKALAYCWEEANGFPKEIKTLFKESNLIDLQDIEPLFIIPEHQVPLPPKGGNPSQNDVFVLAKSNNQLISITVEGKVSEPFGETLGERMANLSKGKRERLDFLKGQLGLAKDFPDNIRYQLLHRTVSAILEAKRFTAKKAIMLVHSFSQEMEWFEDYKNFLKLFNVTAAPDQLTWANNIHGIQLYCGWVKGDLKYLSV